MNTGSAPTAAIYLSFAAGIVSASAAWWLLLARDHHNNNENAASGAVAPPSEDDNEDEHRGQHQFIRWMSMEDIKSRIGELPSRLVGQDRRRPWPWDRRRGRSASPLSSPSLSKSPPVEQPQQQQSPAATATAAATPKSASSRSVESPASESKKSEYCIGSIFGLDVGGTLAKLVYFEQQKPGEDDGLADGGHPFGPSFRERSYRQRASTQAVLMARRAAAAAEHLSGIDERHRPQRQEDEDDKDDSSSSWPPSFRRQQQGNPNEKHPHHFRRKRSQSTTSTDLHCNIPHRRIGSRLGSKKPHQRHSSASNDDLLTLSMRHEESVPDDLHAYAESVHLSQRGFHTTDSMEDILKMHSAAVAAGGEEDSGDEKEGEGKSGSDRTLTRSSSMRKSKSMFDFSRGRIEALDRFYNFAHRLDSYREGVKDHKLSFYSRELGGDFHFIRFETRRMQNAMDLIRANNLHLNITRMGATGGGAHKYAKKWNDELGIEMDKQDELDSLVAGMQFVLSTVVGECYTFRPNVSGTISQSSSFSDWNIGAPMDDDDKDEDEMDENLADEEKEEDTGKGDEWWLSRKVQRDSIEYSGTYPYMLVTIGTGVSILRVDGPRKHERVSGSTIGGGTYWGLIRLLTDVEDFEGAMKLAEHGDASKVDMMVGDIYGEEKSPVLEKMGLASDLVASSFGKLVAKEDPAHDLKEEDLARALLLMITINIGQVAYLNAQMHKTPRIYFVGNFLRHNKISQRRLSFAIDFWSKGEMEALFLEHEGYFGALGAFLLSQGVSLRNSSKHMRVRSQKSMPLSSSSTSSNGGHSTPSHRRNSTSGTLL